MTFYLNIIQGTVGDIMNAKVSEIQNHYIAFWLGDDPLTDLAMRQWPHIIRRPDDTITRHSSPTCCQEKGRISHYSDKASQFMHEMISMRSEGTGPRSTENSVKLTEK